MTAKLLTGVLPGLVASAELYDDPPELLPLPEEEPLIARSVAKRRSEFVTVRCSPGSKDRPVKASASCLTMRPAKNPGQRSSPSRGACVN